MSQEQITIKYISASECQVLANHGIIQELAEKYTFYAPNYKYTPLYKSGRWDGRIRLIKTNGVFPTGLLKNVATTLKDSGYVNISLMNFPTIVKETIAYNFQDEITIPWEFYDYQLDAVELFKNKKRLCVISATGSGKSLMVYAACRFFNEMVNQKILIIVPNISLATQLRGDFIEYSENSPEEFITDNMVHVIAEGSEKSNHTPITIATWQSLQHIKDRNWFAEFGALIIDETHGAKGKVITEICSMCVNAHYRMGLTGSLPEDESDQLTIEGNLGTPYVVNTTEELMERGVVSRMKIDCVKLNHAVVEGGKPAKYPDEINYLVKHKARNTLISDIAVSCKNNTLVLFNNIEHGQALYKEIKSKTTKEVVFVYGAVKGVERERIRKHAEATDGVILVCSYGTYSTGVNLKNLHNVIFAHPTKSLIRILQSIGRGLRLHESKSMLRLFDISDDLRKNQKGAENHTLRHFGMRLGIYAKQNFAFAVKEKAI